MLLEGLQSVQVARVKDNGGTLTGWLKNLFGREDEEDEDDRPASIFSK